MLRIKSTFLFVHLIAGSGLAAQEDHDATPPEVEALQKASAVVTPWERGKLYESVFNREAPVPPQCYTRTEGHFNPCYVCHQESIPGRENIQEDFELQAEYAFSDVGFKNHWKNLFEDRSERAERITDQEILEWVRKENYSELADRLVDEKFQGWIPDLENLHLGATAFDEFGFAKDGSDWVAFNYKPFPSTFWPTNGSFDDVMIRLPEVYRADANGNPSRDVYITNLALLETTIKKVEQVSTPPIQETSVGIDVDGDGQLGVAHSVLTREKYVGQAADIDVFNNMYPQGTEFLHSVRYLDVTDDGTVQPSERLKELRYMYRALPLRRNWAAFLYRDEMYDKEAGKLPRSKLLVEQRALQSEAGWQVSGFIEDSHGRLRVNTFEETTFCMGCHNSIGSTIDKTFSFPRKIDGRDGWGYIDLKGMPDAPSHGENIGEIETYLARVGGGSEFRNNLEMKERWFQADGSINTEAIRAAKDVDELITPSSRRAMVLNKAYRVIVEDQDFVFGRDATWHPPKNVYDLVDPDDSPTLPEDRRFPYNIVLDWESARKKGALKNTENQE